MLALWCNVAADSLAEIQDRGTLLVEVKGHASLSLLAQCFDIKKFLYADAHSR
ncbi:hypothetical protein [Thiocystis violacea]|uniref:hypothetical protein n=1 Tax=Thiocystis violacea TaxID=13725 RepID=UPI001903A851|nr:hypothetical protein [Thiocystis violacea]